MKVRRFNWVYTMLVIAGLVAAIPVVADVIPSREEDYANPPNFAGYRVTVEEREMPEYQPPEPSTLNGTPSLDPSEVHATLRPGESLIEDKILHMPAYPVPPKADILFVIDLTGSMTQEIANVKLSAIDIMTAIRALVGDTHFGVISHMDYQGYFEWCNYGATYGTSADYPYSLDQSITGDMAAVQTAINGLSMGAGSDGPESYARALYECTADGAVGWRAGTKKFVVQFGDNVPHDCNVYACIGETGTTGRDPGRNATVGDGDDILILDAINALDAANICLIPLFSGGDYDPWHFQSWDCWAAMTGCQAFPINEDGTIPGGMNIADYIATAIGQEFAHINTLTLKVCNPAYSSWLKSVSPVSYTDVDLNTPQDFPFQIEIEVPEGTDPGEYCFEICADGDGVIYARQLVCITVPHDDDCIHLDIGEVIGNPGDDVYVPVYIEDVTGWDIFAFETMICWCETPLGLIQYEDCEIGEVMVGSGWGDPVCGICDDFCINVAGAGAGPLAGGGVLFWLKFHISLNAKPGMCCEICFEYANIYDPEQPLEVCLECGEVCVEQCGIGGSVFTWWCRYDPCCGYYRYRPMPGVRMHLYDCNGPLATQYTDANGEYYFGGLPPMDDCAYCVDIDLCPVPGGWITPYDASLVLRYVVCDVSLEECPFTVCDDQVALSYKTVYPQKVAANVNCSSEITAFDASEILRYVVGALPAFACPDPWAWFLLDGCTNCAPVCPWTFDWVGVLIGDVSGPMMPPLAGPASVAGAKVGIPRHYDDKVEVPLLVEDVALADEVLGVMFELTFNSSDLAVTGVVPRGLAGGYMCGYNPDGDNLIIAMAGVSPLVGSGEVARITFEKIRPHVPAVSPRVSIEGGLFNEGVPLMDVIPHEAGREIWSLGLDPASPNPFAEQTALSFHLPTSAEVQLAVYNVNGQLVRTLHSGTVSAGSHKVSWDGTDDAGARVARGVYFCRMETEGFTATEKIVMLK